MRSQYWLPVSLFTAFALIGCTAKVSPEASAQGRKNIVSRAMCVLHPTKGNEVEGVVEFNQVSGGIEVHAKLSGLAPGKHGIHVHEWGDCFCPDGKCTGGHFNPGGKQHGAPDAENRHAGDLGNLEAGEDGTAELKYVDKVIKFSGDFDVIGRAITIHAGEDDLTSQPTGAAGARVAVGVIGIAPPKQAE